MRTSKIFDYIKDQIEDFFEDKVQKVKDRLFVNKVKKLYKADACFQNLIWYSINCKCRVVSYTTTGQCDVTEHLDRFSALKDEGLFLIKNVTVNCTICKFNVFLSERLFELLKEERDYFLKHRKK